MATRYVLDKPGVAVVIIGARSADRLPVMIAGVEGPLSPEHRAAIDAVATAASGPRGDCYDLERTGGGPHSAIMWKNQNSHGAPQDAAAYTPPSYRP